MNIFEFMTGSPWLSFFITLLLVQLILYPIKWLMSIINISKNGWPPPHLDAHGQFKDDDD